MKNKIAILMAAGLGTRMAPLTEKIPKPLVKVFGKPMIETVIEGLIQCGISHLYVVVGYKKDQFGYLTEKYSNLTLLENTEYQIKNNISSIRTACDVMGQADCFICEADLYLSDYSIFLTELHHSCYFGKMVKGFSEDWVFDLDKKGIITRIGKGGTDTYNMVGISYFTKKDAGIIADAILEAYQHEGHEQLYWDEIVDQQLNKLHLYIHPVTAEQIVEIDSIAELAVVDPNYHNYN